jgi:D-psicose/D-tagatose/L-ribulose 3-epimerase
MGDPIGLCSWIFGHQRHGEIAALASELGCDGVELHVAIAEQEAGALRRLYAAQGLRILSLTPENVDLAHQDPQRAHQAEAYYSRLLRFAADLEAPAITLHEYVGRGRWHDSQAEEWQRLLRACERLSRLAEALQVDLLLEPLRPPLVSQIHTAAAALRLCEAVGSPRLRIVLDSFHMDAAETDPVQAIHHCAGRLGAVQLADRQRLPLGQGGIDLERYGQAWAAIGFRGPWILECAVGLTGPALEPRPIDPAALGQALRLSLDWLRRHLASAPDHCPGSAPESVSASAPESEVQAERSSP